MAAMDDSEAEELFYCRVALLRGNSFTRKTKSCNFLPLRTHLTTSYGLHRNRGCVHEISADLLPGLIAIVKDFYQISLWFCKQAFPGWQGFFFFFSLFLFCPFWLTCPISLIFYDEKFKIYTKQKKTMTALLQ